MLSSLCPLDSKSLSSLNFFFGYTSNCNSPKPCSISCAASNPAATPAAVVKNKRNRYRKAYPGEAKGIVEEMRFVAMKLRNDNSSRRSGGGGSDSDGGGESDTWRPSMEGFVKYLVDSKLVFESLERIVDESTDVACEYH